MKEKGTNVERK